MVITTSRRALLGTLTAASISADIAPWGRALAYLHDRYEDAPVTLRRSRESRDLSRDLFQSAEIAFAGIDAGFFRRHIRTTLHQAGAVAKLALCACLLDVGFSDAWNAEHIRQDIAKALAYANATGFGLDCPDMARLAAILTPYWKWGYPHLIGDPPMDDGGFSPEQVCLLIRALLDRVHDVTGHARLADGGQRHATIAS
ncbi:MULTISPECIES: hypothetical protein [Alphaproteobacteria]|jgi:hypothetical protein|uniref:Uncharacterized protein n=1 Tax=Sphingobium yanoikuyae TaxID=13690 RepID=A0A084E288_SPHYA|nr:hypothetical protein [Sphingobium yanoikuyae]KAK0347049.1 hypothetical protein LTR94_004440 [Friedmanniomyces endolithicus]KEZ12080.1 hypothetical protein CP98_05207 [Sphingobium yanoikuyae]KFD26336.1 hypothetical protein IH86_20895 [Sphingobium yanoikuyae]MDV3479525.1 hypothetical protein [Sphingobium yanoikuyae]